MEPTASRPAVPGPAPEASALAALLDCEDDLDALERALLAVAVHPASGTARRAWIARWDERRGWLEGWRVCDADAEDASVAHAVARARRTPPREDKVTERVRSWVASPESLDGALARAWSSGEAASGAGG